MKILIFCCICLSSVLVSTGPAHSALYGIISQSADVRINSLDDEGSVVVWEQHDTTSVPGYANVYLERTSIELYAYLGRTDNFYPCPLSSSSAEVVFQPSGASSVAISATFGVYGVLEFTDTTANNTLLVCDNWYTTYVRYNGIAYDPSTYANEIPGLVFPYGPVAPAVLTDVAFDIDPTHTYRLSAWLCGNDDPGFVDARLRFVLVPEPSTLLLLGISLVSIPAMRRRFKK